MFIRVIKPRRTSVRLPEPLDARLRAAVEACGESQSSLLIECAERYLDTVVREIVAERQSKALVFFDRVNKAQRASGGKK